MHDNCPSWSVDTLNAQAVFGGRRSYYLKGKVHLANSGDVGTVVHDLCHQLEDKSASLLNALLTFLKGRAGGGEPQRLSKLTGINAYKVSEKAWPDDFFYAYVGKNYNGKASNVLSMGLEKLWRDPAAFALKDPDHFDFVFKAVRGVFERSA